MWTRDLHKTGNRVFLLLGQFIVFLLGFIYLDYVYLMDIRPDQLAKQHFTQTECLVMSKKLSVKGKMIRRYRADFLVSYHADGGQYNRWVSGNGLDRSHTMKNTSQEKLLTDYENGSNYTCWFNPKNPEEAFLVPRKNWLAIPTLIVASFVLMMLIFFIRNGLLILGVIRESQAAEPTDKVKK